MNFVKQVKQFQANKASEALSRVYKLELVGYIHRVEPQYNGTHLFE